MRGDQLLIGYRRLHFRVSFGGWFEQMSDRSSCCVGKRRAISGANPSPWSQTCRMTRRKQEQPKRLKSSGDEDESDDPDNGSKTGMAVAGESQDLETKETSCHDNQCASSESQSDVVASLDTGSETVNCERDTKMSIGESSLDNQTQNENLNPNTDNDSESQVMEKDTNEKQQSESADTKSDMTATLETSVNGSLGRLEEMCEKPAMYEKIKSEGKTSDGDSKWLSVKENETVAKERPETPPLQKLMRQDFSPLKREPLYSPSPPKKLKDGFTSKLASVIVPTSSVLPRTASHPKQLVSHSSSKLRSSCIKSMDSMRASQLSQHLKSSLYSLSKPPSSSSSDDQPLDLSKKTKDSHRRSSPDLRASKSLSSSSHPYSRHGQSNGISPMASSSLQSLQQKFGGDFHLRGLRKPTNYMLFGPEMPAIHRALLQNPNFSLANGVPKPQAPAPPPPYSRADLSPVTGSRAMSSPKTKLEEFSKPVKQKSEETPEKSIKVEKVSENESGACHSPTASVEEEELKSDKYTNHMCTCGKWFNNLYSLSLHLQDSGHLPAGSKAVSLLEYPKLVRGQDMWLNQESEQTRRILRCIQCGESFKTLPMLTVHMMKTQHYTKIVSSEHARRAHKCSAYCDRETDKECVFKCKVCQDTFTDMEGLANHMILSGHHKKQVLRSPAYSDLSFRQKRKRFYSFEENLYGNPTVAALLDYKRKCLPDEPSPELSVDNDSDETDSTISCENCGRRIETKLFVEHVRTCLGQRLAEDIRNEKDSKADIRLSGDIGDYKRLKSPKNRQDKGSSFDHKNRTENVVSPCSVTHSDHSDKCDAQSNDTKLELCDGEKEMEVDSVESKKGEEKADDTHSAEQEKSLDSESEKRQRSSPDVSSDKTCVMEDREIQDKDEEESPSDNQKQGDNSQRPTGGEAQETGQTKGDNPNSTSAEPGNKDSVASKPKASAHKLDIIDPENLKESSSGNSALEAMESFIQKSFSSKFDFKKGNVVINPHTSADATIHTRLQPSTPGKSAPSSREYYSNYRNFYSSLVTQNGLGDGIPGRKTPDTKAEEKLQKQLFGADDGDMVEVSSPKSTAESESNGRSSVLSNKSEVSLDKNENLEKKYLNVAEADRPKPESSKSSALDNLSSFVYGQPLTSEHPLDSLQKLITKTDIPKMAAPGSRAFRYLPPHLQLHAAQDLTLPLNLSLKGRGEDSDEEEAIKGEEEMLSDCDGASSPTNSDGDNIDYRCAACSRRFASKGSYRYHLSRCHLSSVKRYGIKEAFNMSPYVYLPLDHTAKFSKYYEMAQELANKHK